MHPLDNVIHQALCTRQASFAEVHGGARRFPAAVTALGGVPEPEPRAYDELAELVGEGSVALFLTEPYTAHPALTLTHAAPLLEMVWEGTALETTTSGPPVLELGPRDVPEMVELATLTRPGPFGPRTHELGAYLGIREGGRLVAMAGERLKVPGWTEVSAVCTHPEHSGHGYARLLTTAVMEHIRGRGEQPFLHVRKANLRAIELYGRLGYRTRVELHLAVLQRSGRQAPRRD
jgi:ribosomal protein S18 acetylase RimI-like enzyme